MPAKIAMESFLTVARRSGLIDADEGKRLLEEFRAEGGDAADSRQFAAWLIGKKLLTTWQAEKLLLGKHKGFFLGRYKLMSLLGKGGMSSVYLAEHTVMRRLCAIKVLPAKRVHDASYLGRFHLEARAVAALDHPNIVRAYDVDSEKDGALQIHFLVMEYVNGESLLELVQKEGPRPPEEAAECIRQAALGLHHAHESGLIHRDIKPGNLLRDSRGVIKLLDMGLARFFEGDEKSLTIQHDEKVLGTADYLAPEQAVDSHLVDLRADVYSLGCTLFFLLTGEPPFNVGTLTQRLLAHQQKAPPKISSYRSDVPDSLIAILEKMMAKKRNERHQTAAEVADALEKWLLENHSSVLKQTAAVLGGSHAGPEDGTTDAGQGKASRVPPAAGAKSPARPPTGATRAAAERVQANAAPARAPRLSNSTVVVVPVAVGEDALELGPVPEETLALGPVATDDLAPPPAHKPRPGKANAQPRVAPVPAEQPVELGFLPALAEDTGVGLNELGELFAGLSQDSSPTITGDPLTDQGGPSSSVNGFTFGESTGPQAPASAGASEDVPFELVTPDSETDQFSTGETPFTEFATVAQKAQPRTGSAAGKVPTAAGRKTPRTVATEAASAEAPGSLKAAREAAALAQKQQLLKYGKYAGAGIAFIVAFMAAKSMFSTRAKTEPGGPPVVHHGGGDTALPVAPAAAPPTLTVGPTGQFPTLKQAVEYLRGSYRPASPEDRRIIELGAGEHPTGLLNLTGLPPGVEIQAAAGTRPVLKATGGNSVLRLGDSPRFVARGFVIDAGDARSAIELGGKLDSSQLVDLDLKGFSRFAIQGQGVAGTPAGQFTIENVRIEGTAGGIGISLIDSDLSPTTNVRIAGCRFLGPLKSAIEFSGTVTQCEVRDTIFFKVETGIEFKRAGQELSDFKLLNCSFVDFQRGLTFAGPPPGQAKFVVAHNLFAQGHVADAEVTGDAAATLNALQTGGAVTGNWSERAAPTAVAAPNAPQEIDLCQTEGKRGFTDWQFRTLAPSAPAFLQPRNEHLKTAAAHGAKGYIGAIEP